jgi:cytochrome c oxidase subunit II
MRWACRAGALGLLSTTAGCDAPFTPFLPGGPEASSLASLGWWITGLMIALTVGMGVLLLWGALRRRGSIEDPAPVELDTGKRWILLGGVALPVVVLSVLFVVTVATLRGIPGQVEDPDLEIEVVGHQWWWEVTYLDPDLPQRFTTANEIHIPVGAKVLVHLESADVIHSFWVPRLHGKLDAIPGHTNHLVLEAGEPGIYRGECAEFCGVQHAHMRFMVVAETPAEYAAWLERQRQPARTVTDPELARGREAFEEFACGLCHTIRGTRARGQVAPDLTHFGSRLTIGAGTLPNDRARLQAWIVDAQSLKPGIRMPSLETFDGATLNALAAYLASLE